MPAYLCHGFRWQRRSVRVFVIVQNLDDASPEWIIPPRSSQCILESFYNLFDFLPYCAPPPRSGSGYGSSTLRTGRGSVASSEGESQSRNGAAHSRSQSGAKSRSQSRTRSRQQSNPPPPPPPPSSAPLNAHGLPAGDELEPQDWSAVKLLEEYDPMRLDEVSRPYAYVADHVVKIDLSVSIFDEIARYEERVRADSDPPITGPCDEGLPGSGGQGKKKGGKKQQQQQGSGWFERLRDQLQRGEEIRWYVVVNGDEVRDWPDEPESRQVARAEEWPKIARLQQEHHSQYMLQQQIFEDIDRSGKKFPVRSDKEKWEQIPKGPPPPAKTTTSGDVKGSRPKTPSKGGFKRLFGRSNKSEEASA
ncbi:hypothetical protein NKR19_g1461 [Coniochaeta hoffmannii]|uniref:Developmental regulator n=1 Tax=Coniochaeta hoffmannii TaxID=91930 RepID=A0AA38S0N1_9PEZI|nr:hypothetical protein NKR19_g1461 [Coniochaeta hoffmannii]